MASTTPPPTQPRLQRIDGARFAKLAALHLVEQDFDSAEVAALLATGANPALFDAWLALGVARAKRGEHALAVPAYLKALALDPKDVGAWTDLGEVYLALMRYDEAAAAFRQSITLDPKAQHRAGRRARAVVARTLSKLRKA